MRWHPDTCECELDVNEAWDTFTPVTKCAAHAAMPDDEAGKAVHEENTRKNFAKDEIRKAAPRLFLTAADANASNLNRLKSLFIKPEHHDYIDTMTPQEVSGALTKIGISPLNEHDPLPGVSIDYAFAPDRSLVLTAPALKANERAQVKAQLKAKFGGKADLA